MRPSLSQQIYRAWAGWRLPAWSVPLALLALAALAYGLLLGGLGFYWDDWPWIWIGHVSGVAGMLGIDRAFRPLSGAILASGHLLAGESPQAWQFLALGYRWLAAAALWWALRQLWPGRDGRATWVALLFLVYPGFTHQFVAVNSSRHVLPMATFFLSLGTMILAVRRERGAASLHIVALLLSLATMLATEYYYGLELLRPFVLWLALGDQPGGSRSRLKGALLHWAPYLLLAAGVFAWRYLVSLQVNYPVTFTALARAAPLAALIEGTRRLAGDLYLTTVGAWIKAFAFPDPLLFGEKKTLAFWALAAGSACLAFTYLARLDGEAKGAGWWRAALVLGLLGCLVAGLPFLATGLEVGLGFPASRATLPFSFGASLLLAGIVDSLVPWRAVKHALLAALLGLAVGAQFQSAVSFQRDWNYQVAFLRQLSWRAPGIQAGTALLTQELPNFYSSDNSLTAPLNWTYAPQYTAGNLPLMLFYLELRLGESVPNLAPGAALTGAYGEHDFHGATQDSLVILYHPPACLRVLHPVYDAGFPQLPNLLERALPLSNPERIQASSPAPAALPLSLFGPEQAPGWCYYFQKADLARQMGDWEQVAAIGEVAFNLGDSPNHASERAPFIQGYAYTGDWERARELTLEALRINKFMGPMLCSLWTDILAHTVPSAQRESTVQALAEELDCSFATP
ncbi:MAG: hypothetical protein PHS96_14600 [Anaerolineales bacterium]|nr:hypothetical protein [Anaerolineales bacterium]